MNVETLKALHGSIAKWEAIVAGTGIDDGPRNCPLCQRFFAHHCVGCPVMKKTGEPSCRYSPYDDYTDAADSLEAADAAQAELNFLRSLLPADTE